MKRQSLNKYLKNGKYLIKGNKECAFMVLDCKKSDSFNIRISKNQDVNLLLLNIKENSSVFVSLNENARLNMKAILKNELKNLNIRVKQQTNSDTHLYFADFTDGDVNANVEISLEKEGAKAEWHLASLSAKNDNKTFDVSLIHNNLNTIGLSDNYGVSKDDARLVFSGISYIKKGAKGSNTRQNAKIMVFDETSKAIAKPVLKIDENEIQASHGASVGKINDEQLFYMTSRGLTEEQARELITLGYLLPILRGFEEEKLKDEISSLIEGRM